MPTEPLPPELAALILQLGETDPYDRSAVAIDVVEACTQLFDPAADRPDTPDTEVVELIPGNFLDDGRYKIIRELGSGLTATVLEVHDMVLQGRTYALKIFKERFGQDPIFLLHEFDVLCAINHPNIVRVRDVDSFPEGHCLKMEMVDGVRLRDYINDRGPLDIETALRVFDDLLGALSAIHQHAGGVIVHRDIKPENMIVQADMHVVLVDFGFSAGLGDSIGGGGSINYRPAEAGREASEPSLDLFALAVTLHEALTGIRPWGRNEGCQGPPMLEPGLPRPLLELLWRAVGEDIDQRFDSADDFRQALSAVRRELGGEPDAEVVSGERHLDLLPELDLVPPDGPPGEETLRLGKNIVVSFVPGLERRTEPATPSGEADVAVIIARANISAEPDIMLDVELCQADNGETWIKAVDANRSPKRIQRLLRGLRAGIHPVPGHDSDRYIELRQAQIVDDPDWPKIRMATKKQLDAAAGVDVGKLLKSLGATLVATREAAWGDESNRKKTLCAVIPPETVTVPLVAYALTRVAPLVDEPAAAVAPAATATPPRPDLLLAAPPPAAPPRPDLLLAAPPPAAPPPAAPPPAAPPPSTPTPVGAQGPGADRRWPELDTRLSRGNGGRGDTWLKGYGYWACHEHNPWREIRLPFATIRSALFGPYGAEALFGRAGRVARRTRSWGPPIAVVVRVDETGLITDGSEIVLVPWSTVPQGRPERILELFRTSPDRRPFAEAAYD